MREEEIECVACHYQAKYITEYPLCQWHWDDVGDPELVDTLAREIYVKEWLIPQKRKELPSSIGVGWSQESIDNFEENEKGKLVRKKH